MLKRKLLLADDSVTIQKVVNLTFADEDFEVITVSDGDAAMAKFVEFVPDLVLVDVNMPGADGYKICEMIKQDDETKHIPVILLVGSFEPFDEAEARRVGADDYLTKPFQSIRQLVGKVSALLDASAASNEGGKIDRGKEIFAAANSTNDDARRQFNDNAGEETNDEIIQTNQIGSLPADEAQKFSNAFLPETASASQTIRPPQSFDEINLPELPRAANQTFDYDDETIVVAAMGEQIKSAASSDGDKAPQSEQPDARMNGAAELPSSSTPETAAQTMSPMNLTPEEIDGIAARVVEKLSDRMFKELAPQIADLVVKEVKSEK